MKEQNEPCATNNTKFSKSSTKGKYIGMDFNSLDDKFKSMMEDKNDENHDPIDVKTNTEEITDIIATKKNIIEMKKDDDVIFDLVVDIAKLFDTLIVSDNFLVYVFPKQLPPTICKRRHELKKSYFLQSSFKDPTKRKEIRKEGETTSDFNTLQSIFEEAREVFHKWLSLQQW